MWQTSFVAATVAFGGTVDDALSAMGASFDGNVRTADLVARLRAPERSARAAALATTVRDIVLAIDEITLR